MTKDHLIEYKNRLIPAYRFINNTTIKKVKYSGDFLYNVLLSTHSTMRVNNLICETLHPENIIAKIYLTNLNNTNKQQMINDMNDSLLSRDFPRYKNIVNNICYKK